MCNIPLVSIFHAESSGIVGLVIGSPYSPELEVCAATSHMQRWIEREI